MPHEPEPAVIRDAELPAGLTPGAIVGRERQFLRSAIASQAAQEELASIKESERNPYR